jgi:NitT/TauT family transport system ATP-binding protein
VIDELDLAEHRPRRHDALTTPAFARLKRHCLDLLRNPETTLPLDRLSPLGVAPELSAERLRFAI